MSSVAQKRVRAAASPNAARDVAILDRLVRGDADAVAELYDRHARLVYALVLRVVQDEAEAEDVVQEVFVQAWQQAARYSAARGTVPAWLLTMGRSRALHRLRARRARPHGAPAPIESAPDRADTPGDHAAAMLADEEAVQLRRALDELPVVQRAALELAYFEALTQREVAARLEEPLGTVETRIRTGLLTLREALGLRDGGGA